MDEQRGHCSGCYRTLQEIADWSRMTDAQRLLVLDAAGQRCFDVAPAAS